MGNVGFWRRRLCTWLVIGCDRDYVFERRRCEVKVTASMFDDECNILLLSIFC